jgi:steroid delta-isomerase-like uncharacterized protein
MTPLNGNHFLITLVDNLVAAWNSRDPEQVRRLYAPEYRGLDVCQAGELTGHAGVCHSMATYWRAFPDLIFRVEQAVQQDTQVVLRWSAQGTHLAPFLQIPATRRVLHFGGVAWLTVDQQRIVEGHMIWDVAGVLRAMNLLPEL